MKTIRYERHLLIIGIIVAIAAFLVLGDGYYLTHETKNLSNQEDELKQNEFDDPDGALKFEILRTKDPELDYVPRERLIEAYQNTERQRAAEGTKSNSVMTSNLDWREIGPTGVGGRTRAIMWDPTDPSEFKVWVGSVSGGLWYSDDITYKNNPTWHKVDDFWDNLAISSIDYDPTNPSTFYVSTGEGWGNGDAVRGGGIWKSTDLGVSWEWLPSTNNFGFIQKLKVHPQTGDIYIALRGKGLRRSTDGGENWKEVLGPATSGNNTSHGRAADIEIGADNTIYVSFGVGNLGEVWKSSTGDEGDWQKINTGNNGFPNTKIKRIEMATAPSEASIVYAMVQDSNATVRGLFKTTNKGNNWTQINTPINPGGTPIAGDQAWYDMILQVHPQDSDTLYAGGINLFRSTNGGSTWGRVNASPFHVDQHMIKWRPNHPDDILFGNDGGVYYTSDGGNSFKNANGNYNVTQFYTLEVDINDPSFFLGGTQDNGTRRITTGNSPPASSDRPTGGDGAECFIRQSNTTYQITSSQKIRYYLSTDGGQNFSTFINDTVNNGHFINSAEYDENGDVLYVNQTSSSIIRAQNISDNNNRSVDTLKGLSLLGEPSEFAASPYSQHTIFVGTPGNPVGVYKMTNANANSPNFTEIANGNLGRGWVSDIKFGDSEDEIVVTKSNYGVTSIYYTSDGGTNWESKEGDLPDIPVRSFLFHETDKTIAYIATEIGVWSTNQFKSDHPDWVPSNNGLANVRTDEIAYRDVDQHIVAATHGRGFFEAYLPDTEKQNMNLLSSRYTPSEAKGIAVNGQHMFVVDQTAGLQVFYVEDPDEPELIDENGFLLHDPEGVDAEDGYVYAVGNPSDGRLIVYDASDPDNVHRTGYIDFPTSTLEEVTVEGDYAYIAAGNDGMHIVNVSNPSNLLKLPSLNTQGKTQSVVVKDNYAFIADGNNGFLIVDVSDKNNPSIVSHTNTSGHVRDLDVQGEYLFVNDFLQGFKIFAINNLSSPFRISSVTFPNKVYNDVEVAGQFAYLGGFSVRVIDISDPRNPTDAGYYNGPYRATDIATDGKFVHASLTKGLHVYRNELVGAGANWNTTYLGGGNQPTDARDIEVVGNYALVANGRVDNLSILDITNPQSMTEIGAVPLHDEVVKVKQRGNYAYVMVEQDGLSIVDISDVNNPVEISEVDVSSNYYSDRLDVAFYDHFAFLAVYDSDNIDGGIFVVDIADKTNPIEIDHFLHNYETHSAKVYDGMLHVGAGNDGYHIFDISKVPNSYTRIDSIDAGYKIVDVKVKGDYAYAAAENSGLVIFDISTMNEAKVVGYYPIQQDVNNVEVDEYFAYVTSEYEGLTILNITDPNNPYLAGYYGTSTEMRDLDVVNGKVFTAIGEAGVIEIRNDLNPFGEINNFNNISCIETNGGAMNTDVYGNYAYVADGLSGLTVVDVSSPGSAAKIGNLQLSGFTTDLITDPAGNYVYTANYDSSMKVVDVSTPSASSEVASYQSSGYVTGVDAVGNIAALTDVTDGAQFIDITDPLNPSLLSDWRTGSNIKDVKLSQDYAFISDGDITIVDITNPSNPSRVTTVQTPGESGQISYEQFQKQHLYVADGRKGITVIDVQNPQSPQILTTDFVGGYVNDIYAAGRYVYVSSDEFGLKALDYIIGDRPSEVAFTRSEGSANGVHGFGKTVYLANGSKGLCLFDNQHSTPSEYDIDPNGFVFEIQPPEFTLTQPVNIINNTESPIEFNLDISFGGDDRTGIIGEWLLSSDYYCDESGVNETVINFFSDNSFTTSSGQSGTWVISGGGIIDFFFNSGAEYHGTIEQNNTFMIGDFVGPEGVEGCWTANYLGTMSKQSIALNKSKLDEAGRTQKKGENRYTITPNDEWLNVEPSGGVLDPNENFEVLFTGDASSLEPGYYAAEVEFNTGFKNHIMKIEMYFDDDPTVTESHEVSVDWNLFSIPVGINETTIDSVFPGVPAEIYGFNEKYQIPENFNNGEGYWIKFGREQTITLSGEELSGGTQVSEGWNIVGPFNRSISVDDIVTEPEGIIVGKFYAYNEGYTAAEVLKPWNGYWVQTSDEGFIYFNETPGKKSSENNVTTSKEDWITINVNDRSGRNMTLHLSDKNINPDKYRLPPLPPSNIFDVRYGDDTYVSQISDGTTELRVKSAEMPYTIQVTGGDLKITDNLGGETVDKLVRDGEKITVNQKNISSFNISAVEIPVDFTLMQNYPNPFNPTTTIKFGLPKESKVDLIIYDILGQQVQQVVTDKNFEPGYHEVEFNGSNFASGVYLYRIKTNEFSDVKKMIMVK